jgi:hypothetical protein
MADDLAAQVILDAIDHYDFPQDGGIHEAIAEALRERGLLPGSHQVVVDREALDNANRKAAQVSAMYTFAEALEREDGRIGRFFAEEIRNRLAAALSWEPDIKETS